MSVPPSVRFLKNNGLSLILFLLFIATLCGQSVAGWLDENHEALLHGSTTIGYLKYLASNSFLEITMENWESEFLQMFIYVVFTVFLYQRGSAESKDPDEPESEPGVTADSPYPVRVGGWRLALYKNSLSITFLLIFIMSFLLHARGGVGEYNEEQLLHHAPTISFAQYLMSSRFWLESLQNWQSEFLSLWSMVVFSIFLRQQGSPESKPLTASNRSTGQ